MKSTYLILLIATLSILHPGICDKELDPGTAINEMGYQFEEYTVQTEDGYLLKLYRILRGIDEKNNQNGTAVLVMHGFGTNVGCFLSLNPNRSLGYILADNGYDVWLLNARGTTTSDKHVSLDLRKNPKEFYNFSWHEIGFYDLPATIDFILDKINKNQIQYVSHSQGGTSFLVMTSMRPEYNSKISLAILMAPVVLTKRIDPLFKLIALFWRPLSFLANVLHIYHINNVNGIRSIFHSMCKFEIFHPICMTFFDLLVGYHDPVQVNLHDLQNVTRMTPSDVSLKQIYHFFQLMNSDKFQQYDYGFKDNLNIYGSLTPPEYNLKSVTTPVAIYVGPNDHFSNAKDAKTIASYLQNVTKFKVVDWKYFNHGDFVVATDVVKLLYEDLLTHMAVFNEIS